MNLRLLAATAAFLLTAPSTAAAFPGWIADAPVDLGQTYSGFVPRGAVITPGPGGETMIIAPGYAAGGFARPVLGVRPSGSATFTTTTGPTSLLAVGLAAGAAGAEGSVAVAQAVNNGTRLAVLRPGQPAFSAPVNLKVDGDLNAQARDRPAVAVTPTGRVLAFTSAWPPGGLFQGRLAILGADDASRTLLNFDDAGSFEGRGEINVLADGTAVIAANSNVTQQKVLVRTLAPGASELGPRTEIPTTVIPTLLETALTPSQRLLIGWSRTASGVEAAVRLPDGSVSAPTTLTTEATEGFETRLRADGTAAITYLRGGTLWQATLSGDTITGPTALLTDTFGATDALVDTSPDGVTVIALERPSGIVTVNVTGGRVSPPAAVTSDPILEAAAFNADGSYTLVTRSQNEAVTPRVLTSGSAPRSVVAPTVTGTPQAGQTLTCTAGNWRGATGAPEFSWVRAGELIGSGATYAVADADAGAVLLCRERRTNAFGETAVASAPVAVGTAAPAGNTPPPNAGGSAPVVTPPATPGTGATAPTAQTLTPPRTSTPLVRGRLRVGSTLRCVPQATTGGTRITFAWMRGTSKIKGATRATRRLARADRGTVISCRVTATNAAGSTTSLSAGRIVR